MTAVTVDQRFDSVPMAVEHILVDAHNGEVITSKLSKPEFCHLTIREDLDVDVNYTISGRNITIQESGGAGVKLAVSIYGKL